MRSCELYLLALFSHRLGLRPLVVSQSVAQERANLIPRTRGAFGQDAAPVTTDIDEIGRAFDFVAVPALCGHHNVYARRGKLTKFRRALQGGILGYDY